MAKVGNGSIHTTTAKTSTFYCEWSITNQSISGNYSDIYWNVYLNITGGDEWYSNAVQVKSLIINGSTIISGKKFSNIKGKGKHNLINGSTRIYHDVTGNKKMTMEMTGYLTSYGNQSGSGSFDLTTIPRYANISNFSVEKKYETSVLVKYSVDSTCDKTWYSIDNGSSWNELSSDNIISGLSANTAYNFKLRVRREDSQLTTDSDTVLQTTYDYPYCISSPDFIIGNINTLEFYNPLSRTIKVYLIGADGTKCGGEETSSNSISGFDSEEWINYLYSTIPNTNKGTYGVDVVYDSIVKTRTNGNTYETNISECSPIFSDFDYKDNNTNVVNITGSNQVIVKGLSELYITILSDKKMSAKYLATPNRYNISCDTVSQNLNYSDTDINISLGNINSSGKKRINVKAFDSRNNYAIAYKDISILDYSKAVIYASIKRLNDFENETTLKVNGNFTKLLVDGVNKNTITNVKYRYREVGDTFSEWANINFTVDNDKYSCSDVVLDLDNTKSFEFEISVNDNLTPNTATIPLGIGEAVFFICTEGGASYINGDFDVNGTLTVDGDTNITGVLKIQNKEILTYTVLDTWEQGGS